MPYTIEHLDLYTDWIEILKNNLILEGYTVTETDPEKIAIQYFNLQKRVIPTAPRKIYKDPSFTCPPELTAGLSLVENKITTGGDLKPHLSRLVKKLTKRDGLLYDWDIYHLHLGTTIESDGYVDRTGPVLFARFDNENAYFIGIMDHGSWTEQQMLKAIHDNWPHTISNFRIKDVIGVAQNFSNDELAELRGAQINTAIEVAPGVVYLGPGGGFVTSGESADVIMEVMDSRRNIKHWEKQLRDNLEAFTRKVSHTITNNSFKFKLRLDSSNIYIDELNNNFSLKVK